jgi:F0F1-type ATP synthase assembly protein I
VENAEEPFPEIPKIEKVPEPPQVNFTRPTPLDDKPITAEMKNRMARRGLSVGDTPGESQSMGRATTIGMNFVGCIVGGAVLGWLIDTYLLHHPQTQWGLMGGVLFGLVTGFVSMIRLSNAINEADEKEKKKKNG